MRSNLKQSGVGEKVFCLYPEKGTTYRDKLISCYEQLKVKLKNDDSFLLRQTAFLQTQSLEEYSKLKSELTQVSVNYNHQTPISIVPQPPANGHKLLLEVWTSSEKNLEMTNEVLGNTSYLKITTPEYCKIVASGLHYDLIPSDIYLQSVEAFKIMENILKKEGLDFSNVVRQWNFIENIVSTDNDNQHYQIFNDVRTSFYNKSNFVDGYPAATGIGMSTAGVIIDFIAMKTKSDCKTYPLTNPVQIDAHHYSKNVLGQNKLTVDFFNTTPKFERAKFIINNDEISFLVSGTAAIKGQESQASGDAIAQTKITIENIQHLLNEKHISSHGVNIKEGSVQSVYLRIYIKYSCDLEPVRECVESYFPETPAVYVIADICRPELLVEIEGIFAGKINS